MFRQTSSRNHRNKGFRVKHALQIFLLLAVCIWLLYQVKHSHDKKKAFEEINERISNKEESIETSHEMLKLGRKDLDRKAEMATQNKKHKEEENEEDEEDPKQEEPEDEDHKQEEPEDEERGVGDDEIDEQDRERVDEEAERGEDLVDEEDKEAQENDENDEKEETEEKDSQFDNTGSSDDQDLDGGDKTTQEAREEHYKGDDASSAVVRDNQMIRPVVENGAEENLSEEHQEVDNAEMNGVENTVGRETQMVGSAIENGGSENLNEQKVENTENHNVESDNKLNSTEEQHVENTEKNDVENNYKTNSTEQQQVERSETNGLENDNRSNNTSDENAYQNNSGPKVNEIPDVSGGDEMANNPLVNATTNEGKVADIITSKSENEFLSTSTATESNKQMELHNNATIENAGTHGLNSQNESTILESTQDQNATANSINSEHGDSNSQSAVLEQNGNSSTTWVPTQSLATNDKEVQVKMAINENGVDEKVERNGSDQGDSNTQTSSLEQREKSDSTNVSEGSDENNATVDANAEAVQPENTDSSSSLVTQEVKDALTDLGTLPQTGTVGKNTEDVAAE